jgi:murein DD-endopeptidase MepM/ murein hydrolase activator NlpD
MNRWLFLMLTVFAVAVAPVTAQTPDKPMIMPAAGDPGPGTWMFGQAYGNTTGAFNFGDRWYEAGQGLHFGIDLAMPCGTPLVAVADGTVQFVDDRGFGSMPHNVIIRHEAIGVTTLYGHLLQTPNLMPGQLVQQGQVIAQSGDPDETCDSRPHLHFEVRSMDYSRTLNPSALIDANWDNLSLIGPYSFPLFQQNLANPRQWVTVEDQPDVYFWGTILNRYNVTYPPRFDRRPAPMPTAARSAPDLEDGTLFNSRPITQGGCCVLPRWDAADSDTFYVSDGPPGGGALVYQWNLAESRSWTCSLTPGSNAVPVSRSRA